MKIYPDDDGIYHINIYSKGQTQLGRLLSNFADTPFELKGFGSFRSVEGYWYWLMTGIEDFRELPGYKCKQIGEKAKRIRPHPTEDELFEVYKAKLAYNPYIEELLRYNELPLLHYYVYNGNVVEPKQWQWTAQLWNKVIGK